MCQKSDWDDFIRLSRLVLRRDGRRPIYSDHASIYSFHERFDRFTIEEKYHAEPNKEGPVEDGYLHVTWFLSDDTYDKRLEHALSVLRRRMVLDELSNV